MKELRDAVTNVMAEANEIFGKMGAEVEAAAKEGRTEMNVAEIARRAGLQIDEKILDELKVNHIIYVHPWLPWHIWWPWRPLWCWWWRRYHPWYYYCCPWWWFRCYWYPYPRW
jgi:hypothetical protein